MNPHVSELLAAYHDGELPANRQDQVENHLQDCPDCRAELEAFETLSTFLKADPVPDHTPAELFAAQVQLRLPRPARSHAHQTRVQSPRWMLGVPLALIILWAFLQAAINVTAFILNAGHVLGPRTALFNSWINTQGLFESSANLLLFNAILLIGITILWSAWMALWLAWKKNQLI
jgi:anti-sigma factor RsiW